MGTTFSTTSFRNFRPILKMAAWAAGLLGFIAFGVFALVSRQIGADVRAMSGVARQAHSGDSVEALMAYVEDSRHSFAQRNRAVWTLGQLGDARALPLLRQHYSGGACNHANALCQRELAKAIQLLEGGFNASAVFWRR